MNEHSAQPKVEFDLLPNALESLYHALDHLIPPGDQAVAKDFKRAILDVSHVVELLLKERLHREHPALIWRKVEAYPSLDVQTVTVDEAIVRLDSICGVNISTQDREAINARKRLRNSIQHFRLSVTEKEARVVIGKMLAFILDFSECELQHPIRRDLQREDRMQELLSIGEFYQEYYAKVDAEMRRRDKFTEECTECEMPSFDLRTGVCEVCGHIGLLDDD